MSRLSPPHAALCCLLLLIACGGPDVPNYSVSAVLPSPAVPGQAVTAFGKLPSDAELMLGDAPLIHKVVPGGLEVTLPEWSTAGTQALTLKAGRQTLTGTLQIVPRIDSVQLTGTRLQVTGAGWGSEEAVKLDVSGQLLDATPDLNGLTANLEAVPYGQFAVRIQVGTLVSAPYTLTREAARVTGRVVLPASEAAPLQKQSVRAANKSSALIVAHSSALDTHELTGLLAVKHLPELELSRLSFASTKDASLHVDSLRDLSNVQWVEFELPVKTDASEGLALQSVPEAGQWFYKLSGTPDAWSFTKGEGITVAVVDTGVDLDHPDLAANLLPGYDFVEDDTLPNDIAGHGTHVAGLVAANGSVMGSAPEAKLLPVRVLEGLSGGGTFTVAQGILYAAGLLSEPANPNPAQIINLSLGISGYSAALADAVRKAQDAGVIVVAATGNEGAPLAYPAALPGVISVTALAGPELAYQPWYANNGTGTWLSAYGGDTTQDQNGDGVPDGILSTELDGYGLRMGTSMASPQVAGLAALALASGSPSYLVRDALAGTATDLGVSGYDTRYGYGLASARSASAAKPRSYVLAFSDERLLGWSLVQDGLEFDLGNLPPGIPLTLLTLSDEDGDGILGEAGELGSAEQTITLQDGQTLEGLEFLLTPSNGATPYSLEATP